MVTQGTLTGTQGILMGTQRSLKGLSPIGDSGSLFRNSESHIGDLGTLSVTQGARVPKFEESLIVYTESCKSWTLGQSGLLCVKF